ncbi:hypothetical protein bthur0007_60300 [Bacillus thuringiensis serovar monterrey BGSC 4AJ1]|nr:hypothetical protein bthur0007_60300 [Bacillus thuringiensis serovar monterrey BGSC 4AJ1]EEM86420.1 hypothetical protein bthur0012_55610 [Bacillus thuringiensis serovar pulsiensis BGSC 4CC1]
MLSFINNFSDLFLEGLVFGENNKVSKKDALLQTKKLAKKF